MNVLAFDTSGESCSVALYTSQQCIEKISLEPRKQAERLLPMVDALLTDAGITRSDLNGLALTHGPGAFTGVRVAISAAQGLAYALDIPVVTVSTLAALAQGAYRKFEWRHVVAAMDARMGEVYWGCYQLNDNNLMQTMDEDKVSSAKQVILPDDLNLYWHGAGSGWANYADELPLIKSHHVLNVEAFDIITLALPAFAAGRVLTAAEIKPVYLRDNVVR
jgi:tRNA threonylcarbamoyladenosine biosynthesis protein TsaB